MKKIAYNLICVGIMIFGIGTVLHSHSAPNHITITIELYTGWIIAFIGLISSLLIELLIDASDDQKKLLQEQAEIKAMLIQLGATDPSAAKRSQSIS